MVREGVFWAADLESEVGKNLYAPGDEGILVGTSYSNRLKNGGFSGPRL